MRTTDFFRHLDHIRRQGRSAAEQARFIDNQRRQRIGFRRRLLAGALLLVGAGAGALYWNRKPQLDEPALRPHFSLHPPPSISGKVVGLPPSRRQDSVRYEGKDDPKRAWIAEIATPFPEHMRSIDSLSIKNENGTLVFRAIFAGVGGVCTWEYHIHPITGKIQDGYKTDCLTEALPLSPGVEGNGIRWPSELKDPFGASTLALTALDKYQFTATDGKSMRFEINGDTLFALKDGALVWKQRNFPQISSLRPLPTKAMDERLEPHSGFTWGSRLFLYDGNRIQCLNMETLVELWSFDTQALGGVLKLWAYQDMLAITYDWGIIFMDPQAGLERLHFAMGYRPSSPPSLSVCSRTWWWAGEDEKKYYIGALAWHPPDKADAYISLVAFEK